MIEMDRLHKRFGGTIAVDEVSFHAPDGCITGLLGPNGAGKTTSLSMLYGLLRPDRGSARVDGLDVARQTEAARRRLGALPESHGLYSRMTGREHLQYFGRLHGLHGAALQESVDRVTELLELRPFVDRPAAGLSQGERRRIALARALVHQPQNLVLDEPTNGLDVLGTRALRQLLRRLRDEGRCILFSSHVMQEVSALCERVVVIARGRVVASGSPAELLRETGCATLEEAFVVRIGSEEGLDA